MDTSTLEEAARLWQQGKPEAALAATGRLIDDNPTNADAVVFHSGVLLHLRRYEEARDLLLEAVGRHPGNASLLSNLSTAQRNCGQAIGAIETAEKALAQAPGLLAAWNCLVVALLAAGQESKARMQLEKALALHPDAPSLQHLQLRLGINTESPAAGDISKIANQRIVEAQQLIASGAIGMAETVYRQAISIHPDNALARSGLGELLLLTGRPDEAIHHLGAALRRMPSDARARHLFTVASGNPPPIAPAEYVRDLFDGMAKTFDSHLRERLAYRVPEELSERLKGLAGSEFGEVLDLGCGTGLVGECLAGLSEAVDGVDLSAEMLLQARAKGCYRKLYLSEIGEFLDETESCWKTVTAADVFIYHGRLNELLVKIQRVLAPGGIFGFSVEATSGEGFDVDMSSGRYRHSRSYLTKTLQSAGLLEAGFFDTTIRNESGRPIAGWIVVARKNG